MQRASGQLKQKSRGDADPPVAWSMRPPWRLVLSYRFHIGRASLCSPFYEVIRRIDEDLDRVVVRPTSVGLGS